MEYHSDGYYFRDLSSFKSKLSLYSTDLHIYVYSLPLPHPSTRVRKPVISTNRMRSMGDGWMDG